ncbi:MAG TPA: hypothetical protein VMU89_14805 [Thermomicrobiaceae bacterium]|nr:hypothetical protein [Thermomicrobiaceae bacterium]
MIQSPAGTWVQAVDSPRLAAQTRAVASQPPPESPASDVPPEVPAPFDLTPPSPGAPQPPRGFGVGRAIVPPPVEPSPDPPPVLFQSPKPIMFEAEVWQLYQWSRQKGFTGTPDECFAQAIKGFYLLRFGVGITAHEIDPRPLLLDLLRGFSGHTEYAA